MSLSGIGTNTTSLLSGAISAFRDKLFKKADSNQDGGITLDEFLSAGQNLPSGSSSSANTDKAKALFSAIDTDQNGSLSKDEVDAFTQKLIDQASAALTQLQQLFGNGANGAQGHHHHHGHPSLTSAFDKIDADQSGAISQSELTDFFTAKDPNDPNAAEKAADLFAKIDTDGDGSLSKDEIAAFDAARKQRQQASAQPQISISLLLQANSAYAAKN